MTGARKLIQAAYVEAMLTGSGTAEIDNLLITVSFDDTEPSPPYAPRGASSDPDPDRHAPDGYGTQHGPTTPRS